MIFRGAIYLVDRGAISLSFSSIENVVHKFYNNFGYLVIKYDGWVFKYYFHLDWVLGPPTFFSQWSE